MRAILRRTAELGEVVVVAFDKAAHYSADPREISRLATRVVARILRPPRRRVPSRRWPSFMVGELI